MENQPAKRDSFSQSAWDEIKASYHTWWGWALAFSFVMLPVRIMMPQPVPVPPEQLKQNPMLFFHSLAPLMPYMLVAAVVGAVAVYTLTVVYLRYAIKVNPPELSLNKFFFWLGCYLAKIFRPILWNLIPVIGVFFYIHSVIRRTTVTPMAVLNNADNIMQRSWDITRGNVWRIIGSGLWFNIEIGFLWLVLFFALWIVVAIAHIGNADLAQRIASGLIDGFRTMANAIFMCGVYRILLKERKQAASIAPPAFSQV